MTSDDLSHQVRHRFVDCPKRRKQNMPEFDEGAMKSLSRELRQRSATSQGVLDELSAFDRADENARLKRDLFELAGAIKVLGKQDGVLPRPCQPARSMCSRAPRSGSRRRAPCTSSPRSDAVLSRGSRAGHTSCTFEKAEYDRWR